MQTACPHCRQTVVQDANSAGRVVGCPRCGEGFQVPGFGAKESGVPVWIYGVVMFMTISMTFWWI